MTDSSNTPTVTIETDAGEMTAEFFPEKAPGHVDNFLKLAGEGFYDGTHFHRVIPGFMIQGGCPNSKQGASGSPGTGGPGYQINAEFNDVPHQRGVLSMARSQDPNSAGSQFFICHGEASFLNGQYTAFGRLLSGEETLDAIANAPTQAGGEGSSPVEPVTVLKVIVVQPD